MQLTKQIRIQPTPEQRQVLGDLSVKQMMKKDSYQTDVEYAESPTPIY